MSKFIHKILISSASLLMMLSIASPVSANSHKNHHHINELIERHLTSNYKKPDFSIYHGKVNRYTFLDELNHHYHHNQIGFDKSYAQYLTNAVEGERNHQLKYNLLHSNKTAPKIERRDLADINHERAIHHLKPLEFSPTLMEIAKVRAKQVNHIYYHTKGKNRFSDANVHGGYDEKHLPYNGQVANQIIIDRLKHGQTMEQINQDPVLHDNYYPTEFKNGTFSKAEQPSFGENCSEISYGNDVRIDKYITVDHFNISANDVADSFNDGYMNYDQEEGNGHRYNILCPYYHYVASAVVFDKNGQGTVVEEYL